MTTVVEFHNEFMFTDELAEVVEDTLGNWADAGVDYHWINPISMRILVPDHIPYADVFEDMAEAMFDHLESLEGKIQIPVELIQSFSLADPLDFLDGRA